MSKQALCFATEIAEHLSLREADAGRWATSKKGCRSVMVVRGET